MAQDIPLFGVVGLYERGTANKGEVGFIGCIAPTNEKFRLGIRYDHLDAVLLEFEELRVQMQKERIAAGSQKTPLKVQTRKVERAEATVDQTMPRLNLNIVLEGGATTGLAFDLAGLDGLLELLTEKRDELASVPPRTPS